MDKAQEYYENYVDSENIMTKFDIAAVHGFVSFILDKITLAFTKFYLYDNIRFCLHEFILI